MIPMQCQDLGAAEHLGQNTNKLLIVLVVFFFFYLFLEEILQCFNLRTKQLASNC